VKSCLTLIILIALPILTSCSEDDTPQKTYEITSNIMSTYAGGEVLTYNFTYNEQYYDGSGAIDASGKETLYVYSGYTFDSLPNETTNKHVTVYESTALNSSVNNHYFYDDNLNYHQFVTGNENYYTNQDDPTTGTLVIPNTLVLGSSWTNNPEFIVFNGVYNDTHNGSRTYTVSNKEYISVPFGNVETFKIFYSGKFNRIEISGTLWVHPNIGIVKSTFDAEDTSYPPKHFSHTSNLVSINWDLEKI